MNEVTAHRNRSIRQRRSIYEDKVLENSKRVEQIKVDAIRYEREALSTLTNTVSLISPTNNMSLAFLIQALTPISLKRDN